MQNVHVAGSGFGLAVGGDLVGQQYVYQGSTAGSGFSPLDLDADAWIGRVETPPVVERIGQALLRHRLLILGGLHLKEKVSLARHLAWHVIGLVEEAEDVARPVQGRQHQCGQGSPELHQAFQDVEVSTLFLLRDAEPQHVEHNLRRVLTWLEETGHYLVITTDATRARWGLDGESPLRSSWWELETREVYDQEYRTRLLVRLVMEGDEPPPEELFPAGRPGAATGGLDLLLVEDLPVREVIQELETPEQVLLLTRFLAVPASRLTAASIRQEIRRIRGDRSAIDAWYQQLTPGQQLFTAGMLFFDGLFDDQLFAALDVLVERAWRPREPALEAFDYRDLAALDRYVRYPKTLAGGEPVEYRSEGLRQAVLEAAWRHRRRQLLVVLPVVSGLVRESGHRAWLRRRRGIGGLEYTGEDPALRPGGEDSEELADQGEELISEEEELSSGEPAEGVPISRWQPYGPERELLGLKQRRQRFYSVVSRSLADVGLLSPYAVERCLYELASDGSWEAQAVAAQTFLSWRHTAREPFLFRTLKTWYGDALRWERRRGPAPAQKLRSTPEANVRATVALAVFYAALGDPPDALDERVVELFLKVASDDHPIVRTRFELQTLPAVVAWHQRFLDGVLWDLAARPDLVEPLASAWARAHEVRPQVARELLEEWLGRCQAAPEAHPALPAAAREARLAAVALTYGLIDYRNREVPISLEEATSRLRMLLSQRHPFVRHYLFRSIAQLIRQFLPQIEGPLQQLMTEVQVHEREQVITPLSELYLSQRETLAGGDGWVRVGDRLIPVWRGQGRPPTEVETILQSWVCNEASPEGQQVALAALTAFAGSELAREEARWRREQAVQPPPRPVAVPVPVVPPGPVPPPVSLRRAPLAAEWILSLVTLGRRPLRTRLSALVGETIHQLGSRSWQIRDLLSDWRRQRGTLGSVGRILGRVVSLHQNRKLLLILAVLGLLAAAALALLGPSPGGL